MGLLKRLMKTPDEDQDEGQDEFNAEESGLLMTPSLPSEAEAQPAEEGPADTPPPAEAGAAPDPIAQPSQGGADPLAIGDQSPPVQSPEQPAAPADPLEGQASSDEGLSMFRDSAITASSLPSTLREALEDVSMADLLADARSILSSLRGGRAAGSAEQGSGKAA